MKKIILLLVIMLSGIAAQAQNTDVDRLIQEGKQLHDQGEHKSAIDKYTKALKKDSKSASAHCELALTYVTIFEHDKALKHGQLAIKNDPQMAFAYMIVGSVLENRGEQDQAIKVYSDCMKNCSSLDYLFYFNYAKALHGMDDFTKKREAPAMLIRGIKHHSYHADSHLLFYYISDYRYDYIGSVFSLMHFLILENNTERAEKMVDLLKETLFLGVYIDENNELIVDMGSRRGDNALNNLQYDMTMFASERTVEGGAKNISMEHFVEIIDFILKQAHEIADIDSEGIWYGYYLPLFGQVGAADLTETLCRFLNLSKGHAEDIEYLEQNPEKVALLSEIMSRGYQNGKHKLDEVYPSDGVDKHKVEEPNDETKVEFITY